MKKKISILLIIVGIFAIMNPTVYALTDDVAVVNNHGISITKSQYNNLLSLGFNDYLIKNMTKEEFDANKDSSAVLIAKNSKYIKVREYFEPDEYNLYIKNGIVEKLTPIKVESVELTKEQYERETSIKSTVQVINDNINVANSEIGSSKVYDSYKTLQTSIFRLDNGQYRARSDLIWTQMPVTRDEDLLKTSVGTNVIPIDSSKYGKQLWTLTDNNNKKTEGEQVYSSTSSKWVNADFNSRTLKPNLKNDETGKKVTYLWIYMYYSLSKDYNGTINTLDAYGEYKHWRITGYDSMAQTHAQANNVNW